MIQLHDNESGAWLGTITEEQLQFLKDQLEEESSADQDYYINRETLDMFRDAGADASFLSLLRQAMGTRNEMEIRWSRTD